MNHTSVLTRGIATLAVALACASFGVAAPAPPSPAPANAQPAKYTPFKLLAVTNTPTGVLLTWDGLPGTREYQVWREPPNAGKPKQLGTTRGDVTHWTDSTTIGKASYWIESVPVTGSGMGRSNNLHFDPAVAPARPLGVPASTLLKPLVTPPTGATAHAPTANATTPPPPPAQPPVAGATDVLDKPFSLDGKRPQRESFGFGLTSPGTVQVNLRWQGGPVTVSLRPAGGNLVASKPAKGGADEVRFDVNPTMLAQGVFWMVSVESSGPASGQVHILSPKADTARVAAALAEAKAMIAQQQQNATTDPARQAFIQTRLEMARKNSANAAAASLQRVIAQQQQLLPSKGSGTARPLVVGGDIGVASPARAVQLKPMAGRLGNSAGQRAALASHAPVVDFVHPLAVTPGHQVKLTGSNFQKGDEVWLAMPNGEVRCEVDIRSPAHLYLRVPEYTLDAAREAYVYFKYVRNSQAAQTEVGYAFKLLPTVPTLASVSLTDTSDPGPMRPRKVVTVRGANFSSFDKVMVTIQGQDYEAPVLDYAFDTEAQRIVTLPSTVGALGDSSWRATTTPLPGAFASPVQASVWLKRFNGAVSGRINITLAPELTQQVLVFSEPLRQALKADSDISSGTGMSEYLVSWEYIWLHHGNPLPGFGARYDDRFFMNTQLANGWVVTSVSLTPPKCWVPQSVLCSDGHGGVDVVESRAGTPSLYAKVHWWLNEHFVASIWTNLVYTVEGPLGMPIK